MVRITFTAPHPHRNRPRLNLPSPRKPSTLLKRTNEKSFAAVVAASNIPLSHHITILADTEDGK